MVPASRDKVDFLRVYARTTPQQIFASNCKSSSNLVGGNEAELNMYQIKNRCRSVDRNKLAPAMGRKDKHDVTSDWQDTERVLEQNYGKVMLFQRGDKNKNREYRTILGPQDNLHCLLKYGRGIVGYDTKYDFMATRFKGLKLQLSPFVTIKIKVD